MILKSYGEPKVLDASDGRCDVNISEVWTPRTSMSESAFLSQFKKLSSLGQHCLQIIAICDSQIRMAALTSLLKKCEWALTVSKSGVLTQTQLKSELNALHQAKMIDRKGSAYHTVCVSRPWQDFAVQQAVLKGEFSRIAEAVEATSAEFESNTPCRYGYQVATEMRASEARRQARIAFYRGDVAAFRTATEALAKAEPDDCELLLLTPFNAELFGRTPAELQSDILATAISEIILTSAGSSEVIEAFNASVNRHDDLSGDMGLLWVNLLTASGDLAGLEKLAADCKDYSTLARACSAFLTADFEAAENAFDEMTRSLRNSTGKRNVVLPLLPGLMHLLLLLRKNDSPSRAALKAMSAAAAKDWSGIDACHSGNHYACCCLHGFSICKKPKAGLAAGFSGKIARALPLVKAIAAHLRKVVSSGSNHHFRQSTS